LWKAYDPPLDRSEEVGVDALRQAVFGLLDYSWGRVRGRMEGLEDDEYLWRPVTPSWSVVRVGDRYEVERDVPPPDPAPLTTIAWLTWHLGVECLDGYTERSFGPDARALDLAPLQWFPTASGALEALDVQWAVFRERYGSIPDDLLAAPLGPSWGVWAEASWADMLQHVADELIHHGSQVAMLRDLHRLRDGWTVSPSDG
jgi:hypothetical protein